LPDLSRKSNQCLQHYLAVFADYEKRFGRNEAFDECLHHFFDQRPAGKNLSWSDRATGLAAAPFWLAADLVNTSELSALALSRILLHDSAISGELLEHLAKTVPDTLQWAIRYSKLFLRKNSNLCKLLRSRVEGEGWRVFFGVCDRLVEQLTPFDQLIHTTQKSLSHLSLLETLSYLSILAYEQFIPGKPTDLGNDDWKVYSRIIANKLGHCTDEDFNLSDERIGWSLKRHLSPIIFPSPAVTQECVENLEAFAVMFEATKERIDYEGSIDWFCFDPDCRYQLIPGRAVIYNETGEGLKAWRRTERKFQALWSYWINRGSIEFCEGGLAEIQIGSAENHELNAIAYLKAIRSKLVLKEIYGLDDEIEVAGGGHANLFQTLLFAELHSVFFQNAYVQPFQKHYAECNVVARALSKLAFNGLVDGENRFPMTWAEEDKKIERTVGWTVCRKYPKGNRLTAKAILNFWTNDLRTLSKRLRDQPRLPLPTLSERPFYKIGGYNFQFPWVVAEQNNLTAAINNLRRIGSRRSEQMSETRRIELRLADQLRRRGFAVEVGYQPERTQQQDPGEVDLICYRDGVVLLLEIKSGYVRTTPHEVWLHRTNTLRKAARQLKRKRPAVMHALIQDAALRTRLGCTDLRGDEHLYCWIIDTSIELDQQLIDGFLVVSLETLHLILRDERQLLNPAEKALDCINDTLFPDGFSALRFAEVVETGAVWMTLDKSWSDP
jgi:hypothetical protein